MSNKESALLTGLRYGHVPELRFTGEQSAVVVDPTEKDSSKAKVETNIDRTDLAIRGLHLPMLQSFLINEAVTPEVFKPVAATKFAEGLKNKYKGLSILKPMRPDVIGESFEDEDTFVINTAEYLNNFLAMNDKTQITLTTKPDTFCGECPIGKQHCAENDWRRFEYTSLEDARAEDNANLNAFIGYAADNNLPFEDSVAFENGKPIALFERSVTTTVGALKEYLLSPLKTEKKPSFV